MLEPLTRDDAIDLERQLAALAADGAVIAEQFFEAVDHRALRCDQPLVVSSGAALLRRGRLTVRPDGAPTP
jgi:hypothetical protein